MSGHELDLIDDETEFLTAGEVAVWLKKTREWVYTAKRERGLPFIQIDERGIRFERKAVLEWLQTRKRNYPNRKSCE